MSDRKPREAWGSRLGIILAVAGSAVGLGNFLRFPGLAAQNGGGTFMIPYFCALILVGIPICWAEWTMGKYGGQFGFRSCPAIFGVLGRRPIWRYLGVIGLVVPVVIYMYYVYIESWCLAYAWSYLTGGVNLGDDPAQWAKQSESFFNDLVGANADGVMMDGKIHTSVVFWLLAFSVNFLVIFRGVSKGIEKLCTYAMPAMAVCAFLVLVRVLTLGTPNPANPEQSVLGGLAFMWEPKQLVKTIDGQQVATSPLADPQVWMAAAGQIFFSLSVGFGVIINYASYLKRKDDVALSGLTACSTNEFFEVCLGGLITIPAAFIFLGAAGTTGGTFGLGFNTLPVVFQHMPVGRFFGFIWFFMLFLAAITSSLSMLQPAIAFLEEGLNIGRRASVAILGVITGLGSLFVIYFSKGLLALDTLDFWAGTALIFVLAMVQVILYSWVFGAEKGYKFAQIGAEIRIPRLFNFVIRYITPSYLIVVFAMWAWQKLPGYVISLSAGGVPLYSVVLIAVVTGILLAVIYVAGKRWKAESCDTSAPGELPDFEEVGK